MSKKIILIFLIIFVAIATILFILLIKNQKKEILSGEITYSKIFKNGLMLSASEKIFKNLHELTEVPIKYPTELSENYKLFAIGLRNKSLIEGQEIENIEIYYSQGKLSKNLLYYLMFRGLIKDKNATEEKLQEFINAFLNLRKEPKSFLIKETESQAIFDSWISDSWGTPKEINLEKEKRGYFWIIPHEEKIETIIGKNTFWAELPFKNVLYVGYTLANNKTYIYLINSSLSEAEMIEIANSIIKKEK